MKKALLILFVCVFVVCCFSACGGGKNNEAVTESADESYDNVWEKHIASLEDDSAREKFARFWTDMSFYCSGIEYELKQIDNQISYEFDPTDDEAIPEEIKDLYDFDDIKLFLDYSNHKDYILNIDGINVTMFFDDIQFYPTDMSTSDILVLVEKYSSEQ